jgi:Terminase small subunit
MTDKQLAFVNAYVGVSRFNATAAARLAGYAHPDRYGPDLKKEPEVAAAIAKRLEAETLAANEVLRLLSEQAQGTLEDFLNIDDVSVHVDLGKAKKAGKMHLLKTYKYSRKDGMEIQLHDAQSALVHLGRHHKLFTDKTEQSGTINVSLLGALTEAEIDARLEDEKS